MSIKIFKNALQILENAKNIKNITSDQLPIEERENILFPIRMAAFTELEKTLSRINFFRSHSGKIGFTFNFSNPPGILDFIVESFLNSQSVLRGDIDIGRVVNGTPIIN